MQNPPVLLAMARSRALLCLLALLALPLAAAAQTPAFVQARFAVPQTAQTSVSLAFNSAQTAGNLNVVFIGWNDATSQVLSVSDSSGNSYALAAGPTVQPGVQSQVVYYAPNIAGGTNTVTVQFNAAADYPDVRIAEYSGLASASPLEAGVGAYGSGTLASSGSVTTSSSSALLVSGTYVQSQTTGPGSGFTQRLITSPNGSLLQDRSVSAAGSYSATAPTNGNGWLIQLVAFRAASSGGGGDTEAPSQPGGLAASALSTSQIDLSWTASSDNVGVTGYRLERCSGPACSSFTQIAAPTATSYSDTSLAAGTSYSYRVRAADAAGNLGVYSSTASATTQTGGGTPAPIAFVQARYAVPQTAQTSVSLAFSSAQTAGNLNVVFIGWNNATSQVLSVSDSSGNAYSLAAGPTVQPGVQSQVVYYAPNIAGGSNTVTVQFNAAADYPDLRIAEYSGLASASPLEAGVGAHGTGTLASSGSLTTSASSALLVSGTYVQSQTTGPGSGFTQRLITSPNGSLLQDRSVSAAGTYSATAPTNGSGWLIQLVAFRAATSGGGGDTEAPSQPGGLAASALSTSQIDLSWTASSDNVGVTGYRLERCSGSGCSSFTQIAAPTATSYSDTSLAAGTSYSYRVRAADAAGNLGVYSSTASASTQAGDSEPPTPPTALNAAAVSTTQINLSWSASTDNVGVTGYRVERCSGAGCTNFAQIAAPTTTSFSNTGLTAGTTYSYRVRAADAAGNLGSYSASAAATTPSGSDSQAPSRPTGLVVTVVSSTQLNLSWTASTDNVGVTGYRLERCTGSGCSNFTQIAAPTTNSFSNTGLSPSTRYRYRVRATDAAGNFSTYSSIASGLTSADTQAPSQPTGLGASAVSASQINLTWTASSDNVGVASYRVERCSGSGCTSFSQIGTSTTPAYSDGGLGAATAYSYRVRAADAAGNLSAYSGTASATTQGGDSQAPSQPTGLAASALSASQIDLSWTASSDNVGVTGYRLERCSGSGCSSFTQIAAPTATSYSDSSLAAGTSYSYRVRAADAAGNLSAYSGTASATTQTGGGTPAPIAFVQARYAVPQTAQTSVSLAFNSAQTAGNLNVVFIGWNDATTQVLSVSDSSGNSYALAAGPTVQPGVQSQVVYYAPNIAGGTNTVTVQFNAAADYPDLRIAEYSGLATASPLEAGVGAYGTGTLASSGSVTTSVVSAVLVSGTYVQSQTTGPGSGFTQRLITSPNGSLLQDRSVSAGTYSATAPTNGSGWLIHLVAFRAATTGSGDTENPSQPSGLSATALSASQINLAWTASSDNVGVTGYRLERCQNTGCSNFIQIAAPTTTSYSDSSLAPSATYAYRVRATDAAGNLSAYSLPASATTSGGSGPAISISSPAPGALLSGTSAFNAAVSGSGIVAVQFMIDGVKVGPTRPAPYSLSYNTAQFNNGSHTISAYMWDAQGNLYYADPVTVTFSNASAGNPAQTGLWSPLFSWPLVSIHTNLSPDGRVLVWDRKLSGYPEPLIWEPVTSTFKSAPIPDGADLFCAGHVTLPDGRILAAGGHIDDHVGLRVGRIFDPATDQWTNTPDMTYGRWYPTLTTLPDGRILTLAGEVNCRDCHALIPEIYNPQTNSWITLPAASRLIPYYPHVFVLPDGRVLVTGTAMDPVPAAVLDVATQTWTTVDSRLFDAYSSAMYLPGKILKTGTSTDTLETVVASSARAFVLDMTVASPAWREVQAMAYPRTYHVETLLPDGNVLVTGGGRTTEDYDVPNAVKQAELWSPETETWSTLASGTAPRLYHSTALLLPDATVLVSGGGRSPGPDPLDQPNAEIFAPPYLFKGPRPTISSAPTNLVRNQAFVIQTPDAARIAEVALIAVGNVTHGINMNQRYLPLAFSAGASSLTATAPANANLAPPGWYMLFLVDDAGVPSVASFVRF